MWKWKRPTRIIESNSRPCTRQLHHMPKFQLELRTLPDTSQTESNNICKRNYKRIFNSLRLQYREDVARILFRGTWVTGKKAKNIECSMFKA